MRAAKALFIRHGAEWTPEGRALLLRHYLSPVQRRQLAEKGYFEVIGGDTGNRYRIYAGAAANVCEIGENGRPRIGLCFLPVGGLPIGDVMLAQKIALETCEGSALAVARKFTQRFLVQPVPPASIAAALRRASVASRVAHRRWQTAAVGLER
jgi:hypothetical protein